MTRSLITSPKPVPFGSDVALMARLRAGKGVLLTQASVSTITYSVQDLSTATVLSTGSLTVSAVVYDTLQQTDGAWAADGPSVAAPETGGGRGYTLGEDGAWGYDFRWQMPASAYATAAQGDTVEARITLTMTDGTKMVLRFQFPTA